MAYVGSMLALCWPMWAANFPLGFAPENGPHQVSSFLWETQEKALFQGTWWGPFSGAKQSGKLPMWAPSWPMLALSWPYLGPMWAPSWPRLGPMLALCWPILGPMSGPCWRYPRPSTLKDLQDANFSVPDPSVEAKTTQKKHGFLLSPRKKWDRPRPRNTVNSGVFVTSRTIHRKLQWRWQVGGWSEVGRRQGRPFRV